MKFVLTEIFILTLDIPPVEIRPVLVPLSLHVGPQVLSHISFQTTLRTDAALGMLGDEKFLANGALF